MDTALARNIVRLVVISGVVVAFITGWSRFSAWPRTTAYALAREVERHRWQATTAGWQKMTRGKIILRYTAADAAVAPMVLEVADHLYRQVALDLDSTAPNSVEINIFPDVSSLQESFPGGQEKMAMGVYWAGGINILSPRAWTPGAPPADREAYFEKNGPLAHELTHLIFDYRTQGNYPHWFSEGLAQYEEYRLTGFLWIEPKNALQQRLYTLEELDRDFDRLPNEALAYREAFLFLRYMRDQYGRDSITRLIDILAARKPFPAALSQVTGKELRELQPEWEEWLGRLAQAGGS
ncbi:MAG: peptidase MA family metallohydrolase [Firmicutes bacterium]|nr:peptidase MA family metallohydrolase [Bacillota bacterium]MCL5040229.1 peptidase MA family metallohydrolase [Bacillota bacterium]